VRIKVLAAARMRVNLLCRTTALLASAALTPCWAASSPNCSDLAAQILTNPDVVAATSVLVPAQRGVFTTAPLCDQRRAPR
jgi:hypothetical protein